MNRQQQILDFIKHYLSDKGFPPTVREIGNFAGLRSSSTVLGHLRKLEENGFIRRDPATPRAITVIGNTQQPEVIKMHKNIASVIKWQGRRYVYDPVR